MRRSVLVALGVVAALVGSACGTGEPENVRIGLVAPLTGPRAFLGQEILNGARTAVDEINRTGGLLGFPVELVVADDGALSDLPGALADLAETSRVSAIIGPEAPGVLLGPRSPLTRRRVTALLPTAFAGDLSDPSSRIVRTVPSAQAQAEAVGRWLRTERGTDRVALLVADEVEGAEATAALERGFASAGVQVIATVAADGAAARLDPAVARLRGAADGVGAVVVWGLPTAAARGTLAIRQAGWDVQIVVPASGIIAEFRTLTGPASEGVVFAFPFRREWFGLRMQSWLLRYQRDHGLGALPQLDTLVLDVPVLALAAYDAVLVAAEAVRVADSRVPAEVTAALATVQVDGLLRAYDGAAAETWTAEDLYVARVHELAVVFDADPRRDLAEQRRFWDLQVTAEYLRELDLDGPARALLEAIIGDGREVPTYVAPLPGPGPVARPRGRG